MRVLVLGVNDVASAVAWYLWREGYQVIVASDPMPTVTRRGMAFADAVFDGTAVLEGVVAQRAETVEAVERLLEARTAVPLVIEDDLVELVARYRPDVVIDARMRKRAQPTPLRGLAQLTIGLGPGFVAGALVDVAIETSWEELGAVRWEGANLPLAGNHARSPGTAVTDTSTRPAPESGGLSGASERLWRRVISSPSSAARAVSGTRSEHRSQGRSVDSHGMECRSRWVRRCSRSIHAGRLDSGRDSENGHDGWQKESSQRSLHGAGRSCPEKGEGCDGCRDA